MINLGHLMSIINKVKDHISNMETKSEHRDAARIGLDKAIVPKFELFVHVRMLSPRHL